ncbi:hypothetical protein YSY43_43940 [Paenibacillus sp. YSY-4.3]
MEICINFVLNSLIVFPIKIECQLKQRRKGAYGSEDENFGRFDGSSTHQWMWPSD